jgi:hypothetical protein
MDKKKNEASILASPRLRVIKETKVKEGQKAQQEITDQLLNLFGGNTNITTIKVEPNVDTINNIINKKDKKKLN